MTASQQHGVIARDLVPTRKPPRAYPTGPRHPTPPEWKARVIEAMGAQGVSKAELARRVGVTSGAITRLIGPDQRASVLVPTVNAVLGLNVAADEIPQLVALLSDTERDALLSFLRGLTKNKR